MWFCSVVSHMQNSLPEQLSSDQLTRKVEEIEKMGKMCVSRPSIALTKEEFDYLGARTLF